jgi:cytochrome c5
MKIAIHFVTAFCFVGCASFSERQVPVSSLNVNRGVDPVVFNRGREIFMTNCVRCHDKVVPTEGSLNTWHSKYPAMAWTTDLSKEDEDAVVQYMYGSMR